MAHAQLRLATLAGVSLIAAQSAFAGGFDRGAGNIELLFDPARVATEAGVTYVNPQRELKDVQRAISSTDAAADQLIGVGVPPVAANSVRRPALFSDAIDVDGDFTVPRLGVKFNFFEPVDCLASYTQPYGADAYYGKNNAYSISAVEFQLDSDEAALTCSYKFDVGKGSLRAIGGVSYNKIDAFFSRQTLLDFGNDGVGKFDLSDEAWSYRVGAAYEIPEIALRASLLYTGKVDLDLEGTVDTTDFGPRLAPAGLLAARPIVTGIFDVDAETEIPQALEFRLQSGVAENTIAFGSVRWQDWSQLQSIQINGVISPTSGAVNPDVSFDAYYEDGWTITAGVGRKFTDAFSGLASITWDKGTSTFQGFQSDTYSVALGGSYSPNKNVELRLGGSIGVLTGGRSDFTLDSDPANYVSYTYDADIVAAGSASIRVKF
ncbi:outer membrane protein transport protein [Mesorhizobium sp. RP14(2022)]|uniref:Outer membrane protein transport protein n=1 Tax=Mesorhizobium liriopis TaxID=2953882 RepID=A0ABT1CB42_9HYPH|nr:outer membrane protein transport protein [Mesorhizobium liriopis]MCO6052042.1 outer membrane protein transport protein [Mesorhizobium liriopis]